MRLRRREWWEAKRASSPRGHEGEERGNDLEITRRILLSPHQKGFGPERESRLFFGDWHPFFRLSVEFALYSPPLCETIFVCYPNERGPEISAYFPSNFPSTQGPAEAERRPIDREAGLGRAICGRTHAAFFSRHHPHPHRQPHRQQQQHADRSPPLRVLGRLCGFRLPHNNNCNNGAPPHRPHRRGNGRIACPWTSARTCG